MKKIVASFAIASVLILCAPSVSFGASSVTEQQIVAILGLLRSFGVPEAAVSLVDTGFHALDTTVIGADSSATSTEPVRTTEAATATTSPEKATLRTPPVTGSGGSTPSVSAAPIQNTPPVLSLVGGRVMEFAAGGAWTDPGVTATDTEDGDLSARVSVSGSANPFLAGSYVLRYTVSDSSGLSASEERTVIVTGPSPLPESAQQPSYTLSSAGETASLAVSSGAAAVAFVHAEITPLHVYVGDTQTVTVKVLSEAPISSVEAVTALDTRMFSLPLEKVSEDSAGETWSASWTVFDTHVNTYRTSFTARNDNGESDSITLAWSDPCSGLTSGVNSSLSANCTVSVVDGLDGGNLTVPSGKTLTLNSGAQWVWNPGKSIIVNGAIAINGTATMKKGYLFYSGSTNDSANTSSKVYGSSPTKSGHVRVATHFSFSGSSLTDATTGTYYYSNTATIGGISNGTSVTLSGSSGSRHMSINGGAWVTSGAINNGQTLRLRQLSSNNDLTTTTVTATVAGLSSTFSVTTAFNEPPCDPLCP